MGMLDPSTSHHIVIVGKKGSGKSVLARKLWDGWPKDRLSIDQTGDALPKTDRSEDVVDLEELPGRWPASLAEDPYGGRRKRQSLRFVPDMGSPTWRDDIDRAMGLAYNHGDTLVWVDEMGEQFRVHQVGPYGRRALHQGRHRKLSLLLCGPRPIDVDSLVLAQADLVFVFRTPNPADRKRIADEIGWEPKEFDQLVLGLQQYEFLRYDAREQQLDICEPLPVRKPKPVPRPDEGDRPAAGPTRGGQGERRRARPGARGHRLAPRCDQGRAAGPGAGLHSERDRP